MPKYEIGYIVSSAVSDDEVPAVLAEISRGIQAGGGKILHEDQWGRKKLAYPIGRTRNGFYVFVTAEVEAEKVREIEHKLNTNEAVIRYLVVNLAEADKMTAKGEVVTDEAREGREKTASPARPAARELPKEKRVPLPANVNIEEEIDKAISGEEEKI